VGCKTYYSTQLTQPLQATDLSIALIYSMLWSSGSVLCH